MEYRADVPRVGNSREEVNSESLNTVRARLGSIHREVE